MKASRATTPTDTSTISRASSTSGRSRSASSPTSAIPNYAILQKARRAIEQFRDQDGRPFEIVELPMPKPLAYDGQRVPATYVNFYFANGALLVPTFGQRDRDRQAIVRASAAPATTRSYWRRLPQIDLGSRRDSLLYAAAAALLRLRWHAPNAWLIARQFSSQAHRHAVGTCIASYSRLSDAPIPAARRSGVFPHRGRPARRRKCRPSAQGWLRELPNLARRDPLSSALDPLRNLHPPRRQDRQGLRGGVVRARPGRRQGAAADRLARQHDEDLAEVLADAAAGRRRGAQLWLSRPSTRRLAGCRAITASR